MRLRTALGGALAILLLTPGLAAADVVATNTFALAPLVGVDGKFHGDNTAATRETDEPRNVTGDDFSVWVRWQAPATGAYTVDLCGNGTAFGTTLGVYRGDDFTTLPFQRSRRANDDFGFCENAASTGSSAVTFNATAGQEYKISVASAGTIKGAFKGTILPGPNTGLYTLASFQDNKVGARNPVLPLGAGIDGATMACSVDDGPYTSCDGGVELVNLAAGAHTVRARATLGGVTDPTPAFTAFTVDTTAPDTSITGLTLGAPGSADALFAATEGNAEIFCTLDGTAKASCGNAQSWDGLCPGSHTVTARARDQAFNYDLTAATRAFTTPAGPDCGNPFVGTLSVNPDDISTFSAWARANVTTNGRAVAVSFQYGPTVTYGRETTATIFAGDITTQTSEQMYGKPGQVLHYRVIARTGDGLVFEGGDSTVVLGSATPATPELATGTPVVTPTTIDLPYTGAVTGTVDGVAVVYRREAGQPELQVAELQPVASDGEDHSGTLHITGLTPDTDVFLLVALTVPDGLARVAAEFPLVVHTPPAPVIQPPPPPPPPPPPDQTTATLSQLKTSKAKLSKLRKGKWSASVQCSAACSVRFTLKKGKTKVAKGSASRTSAGKATAKLKLTKKGKKKLRGKSSIKLKLVAQRSDGGPKLTKTLRFK
jgi:hypothetical protein